MTLSIGANEASQVLSRMIVTNAAEVDQTGDFVSFEEDVVSPDIAQTRLKRESTSEPGGQSLKCVGAMLLKMN